MSHTTYPDRWNVEPVTHVKIEDGCPECGETREDSLIWTTATYELLDGSTETSEPYVKCASCGYCYIPGEES